jgi:hypothetical protein
MDGFRVELTVAAPVLTFTIAKAGGWNKQDGTLDVRLETVDTGTGAADYSATYTVTPVVDPPKQNYATEGLSRMLSQFSDSVDLRALAASYLDGVQTIEKALHPLLGDRNLDYMTGDRLDGLGQVVDVPRAGRLDVDYKRRLRAELKVLVSQGTVEDLISVTELLLNTDPIPTVEVDEYYPKSVVIRPTDHALTEDSELIATMLRRTASAATRTQFVYAEQDDSTTFTLSSQGAVSESSASLGLANNAQTTGGKLSGVS